MDSIAAISVPRWSRAARGKETPALAPASFAAPPLASASFTTRDVTLPIHRIRPQRAYT